MSDGEIWIKTEPTVFGETYVVSVQFGEDRAVTLTPTRALEYASTVLAHAQRAEYDAAVLKQLRTKGIGDDQAIMSMIVDMRKDRPPVDGEPTAPMQLSEGVNAEAKPFLAIHLDGSKWGQFEVRQAREHALGVLEAVEAADLDAGYYRILTGAVGLEEGVARAVVNDLASYRWEGESGD